MGFISRRVNDVYAGDKGGNGLLARTGVFRYLSLIELAVTDSRISREDYLAGELVSEVRHEYVAGHVYAMSEGRLNHQRIAVNFIRIVSTQLVGKSYLPTGSDFKLRVSLIDGSEAFYYPDAMIICEPVAGDSLFTDSPSVILEVLCPTTRRIDETQKYRDYVTIPTLKTYILAEPDSALLTVHRWRVDGFERVIISGVDAVLSLPEAGVEISMAELYRDVVER